MTARGGSRQGERGQVTVMIIGVVIVVATMVVVVVDASAAYRQRQRLSCLADGAALAADLIEGDQGDRGDLGGRGAVDPPGPARWWAATCPRCARNGATKGSPGLWLLPTTASSCG